MEDQREQINPDNLTFVDMDDDAEHPVEDGSFTGFKPGQKLLYLTKSGGQPDMRIVTIEREAILGGGIGLVVFVKEHSGYLDTQSLYSFEHIKSMFDYYTEEEARRWRAIDDGIIPAAQLSDEEIDKIIDDNEEWCKAYEEGNRNDPPAGECGETKDGFMCNLPQGHDGDHKDMNGSGGLVGWESPAEKPTKVDDFDHSRIGDVPEYWDCECGHGGQGGNFCPNCGKKLGTANAIDAIVSSLAHEWYGDAHPPGEHGKEKQMVKVVFDCQVCEKGMDIEAGEIAVVEQDGMDGCIQSKDGGFVCKECWEKFKSFLHDDSTIVLCGADEYNDPSEEPKNDHE